MPTQYHYLKQLTYCMIFLLIYLRGYSQTSLDVAKIDSLTTAIEKASNNTEKADLYNLLSGEYYSVYDIETFDKYVKLQNEYANKSGSRKQILTAKYDQAIVSFETNDINQAMHILQDIEEESRSIQPPLFYARLLHMKATILGIKGEFLPALETELECLEIREKNGAGDMEIAQVLLNIGNVHGSLEQFDKSNEYYIKARASFSSANSDKMVNRLNSLIALNEQSLGNLEVANGILKKCLLSSQERNNPIEIAKILSFLGGVTQELKDYPKAITYYNEALELIDPRHIDIVSDLNQRLAHVNLDLKKYQTTLFHLSKSKPLNVKMEDAEAKRRDHEFSSSAYAGLGDFKNAYLSFSKYSALNDSLTSIYQAEKINELEVKYQTEKKEQEIKLLEEKAKRSSLEKKGMILGIIGLLGLFGTLIYAMRQRMTKNRLAKAKVDQELVFNKKELDLKKQELTAYALQLAHKNEVLEGIKSNVTNIKVKNESNRDLQKIVNAIDINQNDDETWDGFRSRFLAVHKDFEVDVKNKYPKVTVNELRLMALLKMQLTSKEIANILNISGEGIKKARYRLRKKLRLESGDSLEEVILAI